MTIRTIALLFLTALSVSACGEGDRTSAPAELDPLSDLIQQADERSLFHQLDLSLDTPLETGIVHLYLYLDGEVAALESRRFNHADPDLHLAYSAPLSSPGSAVLIHVLAAGLTQGSSTEYLCFYSIDHSSTRHNGAASCNHSSTVAYYLAGDSVGRSTEHPFHDIASRLPLWQALKDSSQNDVVGFYVSVFGTLQNALVAMGRERFDPDRHSIRPVMETIVAQFIDRYQRNGAATAQDLLNIANAVTDHSLPLERLLRYQTIFDTHAHIEDIELKNTGGSLTQRSRHLELLNMSSELNRFFLRSAPYEMSDYRTHVVQNVRHETADENLIVRWDVIPHMYGYNTYFNGEHVGYSHLPLLHLPPDAKGTVTIKAVGYAGEFDGVHHELVETPLIAGTINESS